MSDLLTTTALDVVFGIDIGSTGGITALTVNRRLLGSFDMPVLPDGPAGRRSVNGPLLSELLSRFHARAAFVEYVGARPGEGAVGAFAFGRSRGVVEGVCGALTIPVTFIAPAAWKRAVGVPPGKEGTKDAARAEAIRRWPEHAALFARKRDDGRAESALIAVAGLMRESGK